MRKVPRKRALRLSAVAIIFAVVGVFPAGAGEPAMEVRQATERFYGALNTMFTGDVGPMLDIWSRADDVRQNMESLAGDMFPVVMKA